MGTNGHSGSKSVKSIGRTGHGFAYNQLTGELFLDTNGKKKGFGLGSGLLAVLEDTPAIGIDNFQFLQKDRWSTTGTSSRHLTASWIMW